MDKLSGKKRGRPRKNAIEEGEQEPLSNFQREPTSDSEGDNEELTDPALFEEMNQVRNPKLESKGRKWIAQDDYAKREKTKADEMADEVILIMRGLGIEEYNYKDLHLHITSGKTKLKGELG